MAGVPQANMPFYKREDTWAMIIALLLTAAITVTYLFGGFAFFKSLAVSIPSWSNDFSKVTQGLGKNPAGIFILFGFFLVAFTIGSKIMGYRVKQFVASFTVLYIV